MLAVEVFSQQYSNVSTQFLEQIDLTNYSKGIYSLEIHTNSGTLYKKSCITIKNSEIVIYTSLLSCTERIRTSK